MLHVLVVDMLAQGIPHQLVLGHVPDGVLEGIGQAAHVLFLQLLLAHEKNVPVDSGRRRKAPFYAVKTRRQAQCQHQIRIGRRVGIAKLDAGSHAAGSGNADKRAAVGSGPGDINRRFKAGHQPLI